MTNINHLELLLAEGLLHYQVRTNIIILFGIHQSKCPRVSIAKNDEQTENEGAKMNDMYVPDRFNAHKVSYRCKWTQTSLHLIRQTATNWAPPL